jgi:hypothetical protein
MSASANADEGDFWYVQTSVYTRHWNPDPAQTDSQQLIGLERNFKSGTLIGAATFRNSYSQRSYYGYVGKRWENDQYPVYVKLSGGLLEGYKGEYRDRIPLNRFGIAPVIIPSLGAHLGPIGAELVILGTAAAMVDVGYRF